MIRKAITALLVAFCITCPKQAATTCMNVGLAIGKIITAPITERAAESLSQRP